MRISIDDFTQRTGLELEKWAHDHATDVDPSFASRLCRLFLTLDAHHQAIGLYLLKFFNSDAARRIAVENVSSSDLYVSTMAREFLEWQRARDWYKGPIESATAGALKGDDSAGGGRES